MNKARLLSGFLLLICLGVAPQTDPGAASRLDFPEPEALRPAVAFWMRVYLEVTTDGGILHDSRHLGLIYETVRFEGEKSRRKRERIVDAHRKTWRTALRRLSRGMEPRDDGEMRALLLLERALGHKPTARDLANASRRVRFQLGQRDKFRRGIIRSGGHEDAMRAVFRSRGLPEDLAYLPHVESSFNHNAYSKYGAAGLWQFMRRTGSRYLRIDYVVDERLDPMAATVAAASLLEDNYAALESWPLAITAYNHGRSGMKRAQRRLGTAEIDVIVEKYRSRTFGFASRNFYAQFLAARRIIRAYPSYFGPVERESPKAVDEIRLPFFADVSDIRRYLEISPEVIRQHNPALRPPVFRSGKRIPRDYMLRLPAGTVGADPEQWFSRIPAEKRHAKQHRSHYYQVRRGDTLSQIARRNQTSIGTLVAINSLPSRHRIYPGQVLQLPERPSAKPSRRRIELVKTANAAPARRPPATLAPVRGIDTSAAPAPPIGADSPWRRVDGVWIIVDSDETIGHLADWLRIPASRLRELNRLPARRRLRMGQRLRLEFEQVTPDVFLQRRVEYHKGIEEDFFGSYRVRGTIEHELVRGDNLWALAHKTYGVPTWLLRRFNPTSDLTHLSPGTKLIIPIVENLSSS